MTKKNTYEFGLGKNYNTPKDAEYLVTTTDRNFNSKVIYEGDQKSSYKYALDYSNKNQTENVYVAQSIASGTQVIPGEEEGLITKKNLK